MDNGPEKKNDWLATKVSGAPAVADYEFSDRACHVHAHWMVGFDELEIAAFYGLTELEVNRDLQYILGQMSARQVLSQTNDRNRIRVQREHSKDYTRLLKESLTMGAKDYIAAGMSPVPAMKEFREAVAMTEKPGGLSIQITKNTANFGQTPGGVPVANIGGRGGVRSFEDLVRLIIEEDPSCGLQPLEGDAQDIIPPLANPLDDDEDDLEAPDESDDIDDPTE